MTIKSMKDSSNAVEPPKLLPGLWVQSSLQGTCLDSHCLCLQSDSKVFVLALSEGSRTKLRHSLPGEAQLKAFGDSGAPASQARTSDRAAKKNSKLLTVALLDGCLRRHVPNYSTA